MNVPHPAVLVTLLFKTAPWTGLIPALADQLWSSTSVTGVVANAYILMALYGYANYSWTGTAKIYVRCVRSQ